MPLHQMDFKNLVTKEEIAQNKQFHLLPHCFPLLGYPFNYRDFLFFDEICSKLSAAELLYEGKGLHFFQLSFSYMTSASSQKKIWHSSTSTQPSSQVLRSWWSAHGQGTFSSLVLVCLPRDHE